MCAVERDGGVIIPNGNFVLQNGDQVTFRHPENAHAFFRQIHMPVRPVRNALIVGGGAIAFYLSQELLDNHVRVRIVERDAARARSWPSSCPVPRSSMRTAPTGTSCCRRAGVRRVLCGPDQHRRGKRAADPVCQKHSHGKLVTKVNRRSLTTSGRAGPGQRGVPKYMTCDYIVQYVRALQNEAGSNIKTLYRILDDRVEALEFTVHEESRATGVPLSQLHLKRTCCCAASPAATAS